MPYRRQIHKIQNFGPKWVLGLYHGPSNTFNTYNLGTIERVFVRRVQRYVTRQYQSRFKNSSIKKSIFAP